MVLLTLSMASKHLGELRLQSALVAQGSYVWRSCCPRSSLPSLAWSKKNNALMRSPSSLVGISDWKHLWYQWKLGGALWLCKMGDDKCIGCWRELRQLQHISLAVVVTALVRWISLSRIGCLCLSNHEMCFMDLTDQLYRNKLCNWFRLKTSPQPPSLPPDENQEEKEELFVTIFALLPYHTLYSAVPMKISFLSPL